MKPLIWIPFDIPSSWEQQAKETRQQRDKLYGNIYLEESSDIRWVGDLGEICFKKWIQQNSITKFEWHLEKSTNAPDFTINGLRIDIKTVKRQGPPKRSYTAQITAQHKTHPIDELFFMSYEFQQKRMWLLGGIKMSEFINKARYYKEGEYVHPNYQIRKGHEIYNAEISLLESPAIWIKRIQ